MTDSLKPGDQGALTNENNPKLGDESSSGVEPQNLTNQNDPNRPTPDEFKQDIGEQTPERVHQQELRAESGEADKAVGELLPDFTDDELSRLSILKPGTPLEQGSVYLNLNDRKSGPFKAIGGQEVGAKDKMIAKNMTDYMLWNKIAGRDDTPEIERPS